MHRAALACLLLCPFTNAQDKPPASPAAPAAKTWMDLGVGTDLRYRLSGADECKMGGGTGSSGNAAHELRVVGLATEADGKLRIAVIDEAVPEDKIDVPIVRGEFALLDPATGVLTRTDVDTADPLLDRVSPIAGFPYPPLSAAEWQAKKPVQKDTRVFVNGEPQVLPLTYSFTTRKDGKTQTTVLVADLAKPPAAIKLAGIAGMIDIAEGRMPKIGSIEPVDASVTALHRECTIDFAKGRVLAIRSTSTTTAAGGKMTITGSHTLTETGRRQLAAAALAPFAAAITEICAISNSRDGKAQRRERAVALQAGAAKLELGPTVERLIDSLTRDGLPPGLPR